ncbi:MAG: GTP-binding protein [Clostridium sulfidigenes]|uniref:GTP-binding protein n=1 Tax=Clostridium sulfidigenes TaxID=318464 RepID=A0A927ZJ48_9CLOT|nr:GTP-binding protein [Clostridium sulfidigenes]
MGTNINIISGFLGCGKTTFLNKVIPNMQGSNALIENEFGNIGIDGDLIQHSLPIKEIYSGCICCTVKENFNKALEELVIDYKPDNIFIEPSGVGSLSDILKVCNRVSLNSTLNIKIKDVITIVDVDSFNDYSENFGSFYLDQIENAQMIFLSHFENLVDSEVEEIIEKISLINPKATIFKEPWISLSGEEIVETINSMESYEIELKDRPAFLAANKMFETFSIDKLRAFSEKEIYKILLSLNQQEYGFIVRAKGIVQLSTKKLVYFDYTPHNYHWEYLETVKTTKVTVIGSNLDKKKIVGIFY